MKRSIAKAVQKGEKAKVGEMVASFYKAVDKAAKAGAIHTNKASREKSRILAVVKKGGAIIARTASKTRASKKTAKAKAPKATPKKGSGRKGK